MMPLTVVDLGNEVTVQQCHIKGDLKRHTDSLGILPGEKITPVSKTGSGLIVQIKNCRFAVDFGLATKIYVA